MRPERGRPECGRLITPPVSGATIATSRPIRGSGNLIRDLGYPDADREQPRALLAVRIIAVLEEGKLTVLAAQDITGVAAPNFSRVRKACLGRSSIDRLTSILARLGQEVEAR